MSQPEIISRMERALAHLEGHWSGRRKPKAFYLGPADWEDFIATGPPIIASIINREPAREPGFHDIPVRPSKNVPPRQSSLYDNTGTGRPLPDTPAAPRKAIPQPGSSRLREEAALVEKHLDTLSRQRCLEDWESHALEEAIRIQEGKPRPPRRPWGWTRLLAAANAKRSGNPVA